MASGAPQDHSEYIFSAMDNDNNGEVSVDEMVDFSLTSHNISRQGGEHFSLTPQNNRQSGDRLSTALASEDFSAEGISEIHKKIEFLI